MADLYRTLIIPAADAAMSRAIAEMFGPGGVGMWITPLSASGQEPATHYISSGLIPAEFAGLSPCATWSQSEQGNWVQTAYDAGDADAVYGYCQQASMPYTLAEIEGVFSRSDVSAQEPFVAMDRLGLKIISPPLL